MKFQVIGVMPSQGEFKPAGADSTIKYNNVNLFVADLESPCTIGHQTNKLKIKADLFNKLVPEGMNSLANAVIDVYYNQYGNVDYIQVIKK